MKLQTKLITAFTVVVLLMGISQSIFLESRIQATFQEYLDQQNVNFMMRMEQVLELYYEETGSWKNAQQLFFSKDTGHPMMMRGMLMNMSMLSVDLLLLDRNGTVIADSAGKRIGSNGNKLSGKPKSLMINGEKKGTLLLYQSKLQNLEEKFLYSSKIIILISSIIAAGVAVLFSLFIARKISNPLKTLMGGIKQIASGEKVNDISISTNDEFHELGEAFNNMARKLERNEEIRRSLVADVAHELRTPLAILQGKLESIQEGVILPTEGVILELTDEVYRLSRLVQDLQQLSLAEAGKLPLNIQPEDLHRLIGRICSSLQWLADEKKITLNYTDIPDNLLLNIDSDRMTQVIVNLVGNALRHTPEHGMVEVCVNRQETKCFIKVADTGCGIPENILPFIFDRFYKRDPSRSRNEGSTGLGLSIAKGFVEAHGGTISVESKQNECTVFTITLPILA
jgi:two-component system, OmpR family, sensor histidine kinase BaeS